MKNIIIDAGPTNERIDAVMKITNMSTGALGSIVADTLLENYSEDIGTIFYICPKLCYKPKTVTNKIKYIQIDSTNDLLKALEDIFKNNYIDAIVHSSAVGDYKGKYVVRAEDIIDEILESNIFNLPKDKQRDKLLNIFKLPKCVCNDKTKISSYEENLMVKLDLTPKVISKIKEFDPNVKLIGFKLLESVTEEELFDVAYKLLIKNNADYIISNLLNKIGNGKHFAMVIDKNGIRQKCNTKKEIAQVIGELIFCK